jgi:hypothetical protein
MLLLLLHLVSRQLPFQLDMTINICANNIFFSLFTCELVLPDVEKSYGYIFINHSYMSES